MTRKLIIGAAQLGPIARNETRRQVVARMLDLMQSAAKQNCRLVVFPELALTTFFPRWYTEDQQEIDQYFETEMPGPDTQVLFDTARELGMGFHLGYAELVVEKAKTRHFNTAITVDESGTIVGKYRKIHLPGHTEHEPTFPFQHLEKRYFDVGDLGFVTFNAFNATAGMCICNDRRWPESFRTRSPAGFSQSLKYAGRRLSERHLGDRSRQGGPGRRLRPDRWKLHYCAHGRNRYAMYDAGRRTGGCGVRLCAL